MTLWEHLGELRKRLMISVLAIIIFGVICYINWEFILKLLIKPAGNRELVYLNLMEPFMARFKVATWGGFLLAFPIVIYQILAFILPGLEKREKVFLIIMSFLMFVLFFTGIYFGYTYVLTIGINWLESQGAGLIKANLTVSQYVSFIGLFLFAFGACFQTPVVVVFLAKIGAVKPIQLVKQWRVAVIVILLFSAIATPDWSPVTMVLMAVPMTTLYILGVILAFIFAPRKKKDLAEV